MITNDHVLRPSAPKMYKRLPIPSTFLAFGSVRILCPLPG